MQDKYPVPSPDGVPRCFGVQFDAVDETCAGCEVRSQCAPRAKVWHSRESLAEMLARTEALLAQPEQETLQKAYDRLHREIFGSRSKRTASKRNEDIFAALFARLRREEIDFTTYVAGNMWAMKPWVEQNPRIGFQVNHLSGERAMRRYHAYKNRQRRRYRQARHTGQTGGTSASTARQRLYQGEFEVGLEYVRAFIADGVNDWRAAVEAVQPNADWKAACGDGSKGRQYHELCLVLGTQRLRAEVERARLRAACDVADHYEYGLSQRVGVNGVFSWRGLAALLARLFPLEARFSDPVSLKQVEGVEWHGDG